MLSATSRPLSKRASPSTVHYSATWGTFSKLLILTKFFCIPQSLKCGPPLPSNLNECLLLPAKIELMMWLGPHRQSSCFATSVPSGYTFKLDRSRMFLETTARVSVLCRASYAAPHFLQKCPPYFDLLKLLCCCFIEEDLGLGLHFDDLRSVVRKYR